MTTATETAEAPVIDDPKAVLEALERAKREAKQFREERDAARSENQTLQASLKATEGLKSRYVASEARLALLTAGVKDTERVSKYLNLSEIEIDDDGKVQGLGEKIDAAKKDLPELFDAKRRVGGAADLFADGGTGPQKSASEIQAEKLLGRRA